MSKKLLSAGVLSASLLLGNTAFAQQPAEPAPPPSFDAIPSDSTPSVLSHAPPFDQPETVGAYDSHQPAPPVDLNVPMYQPSSGPMVVEMLPFESGGACCDSACDGMWSPPTHQSSAGITTRISAFFKGIPSLLW